MRWLLIVACLSFAGCASTEDNKLPRDGKITVECSGKTFEDAKTKCFNDAIEYVVGKVLLSETKVADRKLLRDEIIKHSSGYVDDFTITSKTIDSNKVSLTMDVKVRTSKIAERVLGVINPETPINGSRMLGQYQSYLDSRQTGDKLIMRVLIDYPKYAFNIEKYPVEFKLDKERNAVVIVPFSLKWNYKYLTALNEALSIVEDGKGNEVKQETISVQSKNPKNWILGKTDVYYFNDYVRSESIQSMFLGFINVRATLADNSERKIFEGCKDMTIFGINHDPRMIIRGNEEYGDTITIMVNKNDPKYRDLDNANNIKLSFSSGRC